MEQTIRFCTSTDGIRIAYATVGDGPPHVWNAGWVSHLELDWQDPEERSRIEYWAERYTIVRYDKRGTGLSDRNIQNYSIDARVGDLEAVVDHLKLRRFLLWGASEGGPVAITYAARYPRRVSRLILSGTYANGRSREKTADAIAQLFEAEWGLASGVLAKVFNADASLEEQRAFASYQRKSASAADAAAMMRANAEIDISPLLSEITAPTLVIHGKQDLLVPFELGRELASKIPNARLFAREGGHFSNDEAIVLQVRSAINEFLAEEQPAKRQARREKAVAGGPLTVLFTDIVGHTEMMQRLGDDAGRAVLREHERITRQALKQHGGAEVKTDGDSFMASFASVSAAVECAVALQRAFAAYSSAADDPIVVRIGLNVGEPIEEDGDFFGSAVILGARIKDQATGGEILVPEAVRHLLAGKDFLFSDRGVADLKGFEDPVRLYEVRWRE